MFRVRFAESLIYTVLNINVKTLLPETLLQHITYWCYLLKMGLMWWWLLTAVLGPVIAKSLHINHLSSLFLLKIKLFKDRVWQEGWRCQRPLDQNLEAHVNVGGRKTSSSSSSTCEMEMFTWVQYCRRGCVALPQGCSKTGPRMCLLGKDFHSLNSWPSLIQTETVFHCFVWRGLNASSCIS